MFVDKKTYITHPPFVNDVISLKIYEKEHIPYYKEWMNDSYLREMTGSEGFDWTDDQHIRVQQGWYDDLDKICYVIQVDEAVVGDICLSFTEDDGVFLELEIMVGNPSYRQKGIAQAVLEAVVVAFSTFPNLKGYLAKIKDYNEPSLNLFRKLGFQEVARIPVFEEVHLKRFII